MTLKEQRQAHFDAFKQGRASLFLITAQADPALPPFVFRKIDAEKIALLAWRGRGEAEKWCSENAKDPSRVTEITGSDFQEMLAPLTPSQRQGYNLEVI